MFSIDFSAAFHSVKVFTSSSHVNQNQVPLWFDTPNHSLVVLEYQNDYISHITYYVMHVLFLLLTLAEKGKLFQKLFRSENKTPTHDV